MKVNPLGGIYNAWAKKMREIPGRILFILTVFMEEKLSPSSTFRIGEVVYM